MNYEYGGVSYPLYRWQYETKDKWIANGCTGIAQATTGTGKTRLAHACMAHWIDVEGDFFSITIIVPTIPLLDQWHVELSEIFTSHTVGRVGGGYDDWQSHINIIVMASAAKRLYQRQDMGNSHLVIVDECHRIGARESRKALSCKKKATLGLSATPEREDSGLHIVGELLGDVLIQYRYADALADGVIPPFTLKAVQAELSRKERGEYDRLQRSIVNLTKSLSAKYGGRGNLVATCQGLLKRGVADKEIGTFLKVIREQKELLNSAKSRFSVLDILIAKHTMKYKQKTMVFHESVEEIEDLVKRFKSLKPLQYHYKIGGKKAKQEVLNNFKDGVSNLLFSCRALTEGFNIPDAEVGIMVSGTRSVRSRIQTLGRLLRGDEATVYFIYVPDTKDTRSLSNLLGKGGVPKENVEYWKFDKSSGNMVCLSESQQGKQRNLLESEYQRSQSYQPKNHGRLECKHCGRGMELVGSKPFRTPNGLKSHMETVCKDAQRGIFRCGICSKAYQKEENRNACLENCSKSPPNLAGLSWDDFMEGFGNRNKLHDVEG